MTLTYFVSNPWVIAAAGFVAAEVGVPLVRIAIAWLRSRFGPFTGTYVALTGDIVGGPLLLEKVICRNIGAKLIGKIEGLAVLEFDKNGRAILTRENHENYTFSGLARDRLFTISYSSTNPRTRSSGLIVISGDDSGSSFLGHWAGSVEDYVANTQCVWLRLDRPSGNSDAQANAKKVALQYIEKIHASLRVDWKRIASRQEDQRKHLIDEARWGSGKSVLAPHLIGLKYKTLLDNSVFAKVINAQERTETDA